MPELFEKLFLLLLDPWLMMMIYLLWTTDPHQGASPCMQSIKNFLLKPHDISPTDSCSSELNAQFGGSVYSDSKY
jgi:hypothetical protein